MGLGSNVRNLIKIAPDGSNHRLVQNIVPIDFTFGGENAYNASENAIYFAIQSPGGADLLTYSIDDSNTSKITALNTQNGFFPNSSADGTTIVGSIEVSGVWHVVKMNADGAGSSNIATGGSTGGPIYNLQNTQIAYADNNVINIISPTGTLIRTITLTGVNIADLSFNPGGTTLAFDMQPSSTSSSAIYTVPTAGGTATKRSAGNGDVEPVWSPDGTKIAYLATGAGSESGVYYIYWNSVSALGIQVQSTSQGRITMMWR